MCTTYLHNNLVITKDNNNIDYIKQYMSINNIINFTERYKIDFLRGNILELYLLSCNKLILPSFDVVKYLINNGADFSIQAFRDIRYELDISIIKCVLKDKNLNEKDKEKDNADMHNTSFFTSYFLINTKYFNSDVLKWMIDAGANINDKVACYYYDGRVYTLPKINVNFDMVRDFTMCGVLWKYLYYNDDVNVDAVKLLCENGININEKDNLAKINCLTVSIITAIDIKNFNECHKKFIQIIQYLLSKNIEIQEDIIFKIIKESNNKDIANEIEIIIYENLEKRLHDKLIRVMVGEENEKYIKK